MNYETNKPVDEANKKSYQDALNRPATTAEVADMLMRNVDGYEAIADPDKALGELGRIAVKDAEDILNPQHQPDYEALEGGRFDAIDSEKTFDDARAAHRQAQAGITSFGDGTHTLSWEGHNDVTIGDNGQAVEQSSPNI